MKILMCNKFHFIHGGAERYLFDLSYELQNAGCEILNFAIKDPRNLDSKFQDFFVEGIDYDKVFNTGLLSKISVAAKLVYSFEAKGKIAELVEAYHPHVAHIHNIYHQISPSILDVLRRKKIPIVMTLHDYKVVCPNYKLFTHGKICERCKGGKYYNCYLNRCIRDNWQASLTGMFEGYAHALMRYYDQVDRFIVPSRFVMEKVLGFGIPRTKVIYLPYAIDLSEFLSGSGAEKFIVYSGRLLPEKGLLTLFESLKYFPGLEVKIIGDGPYRHELEELVSRWGLSSVEFLGHRSRSYLSKILRDALCLVVPSLWPEPAGLIIYEAFASKKCVIASNLGGIPELIEDGVNGLLFEAGNSDALAMKLSYVVNHPEQAKLWGEAGFLKIQQCNNLKAHAMQMKEIYHEVLNRQPKGGS